MNKVKKMDKGARKILADLVRVTYKSAKANGWDARDRDLSWTSRKEAFLLAGVLLRRFYNRGRI